MPNCTRIPALFLICIATIFVDSCQSERDVEATDRNKQVPIKVGAQVLLEEHLDELKSQNIAFR